jgi:hypothetical protein
MPEVAGMKVNDLPTINKSVTRPRSNTLNAAWLQWDRLEVSFESSVH